VIWTQSIAPRWLGSRQGYAQQAEDSLLVFGGLAVLLETGSGHLDPVAPQALEAFEHALRCPAALFGTEFPSLDLLLLLHV